MRLRQFGKGLGYFVGGAVTLVLLIVAAVLVGAAIDHRAATPFPKPTGQYAVGRTLYHWVDASHADQFAPTPGVKRELMVWIWYPALASGARAEYLPSDWRAALSQSTGALMTRVLTRDLAQVRIFSADNAELSPDQPRYPVVVLRAGASALVASYTAIAEELASQGYIVVGPDAPYRTTVVVLPRGRIVNRLPQNDPESASSEEQREALATRLTGAWSADIGFILDELAGMNTAASSARFAGRLDLLHIGVFGHSLGGATAAEFCRVDARCKAGVDLDGRLFGPVIGTGLKQPFLFILEGHGAATGEASKVLAGIESMYVRLPAGTRLRVSLAGSNHFSFSDQILLKPFLIGLMRTVHVVRLDPLRGLAITSDYVRTFFDVYLKGGDPTALNALKPKYPEAVVE